MDSLVAKLQHKLFNVYINCLTSVGSAGFRINMKLTGTVQSQQCVYTGKYTWYLQLLAHLVSSQLLTFGSPKTRKRNSCSQHAVNGQPLYS